MKAWPILCNGETSVDPGVLPFWMLQKFKGDAARLLLETGNMQLQERVSRGNGRPEDLWSIGPSGLGQNLCGECLMAVRQMLREAGTKRVVEVTLAEDNVQEKKSKCARRF